MPLPCLLLHRGGQILRGRACQGDDVRARRHGSRGAAVVVVMMALHFLSRALLLLQAYVLLLLLLLLLLCVLGVGRACAWTYVWHKRYDSENDRAAQKGFSGQRAVLEGVGKIGKRAG